MAIELLCRKIGMTRFFDEAGESVAVTLLEAGPNAVVQVKTPANDGYAALQLGFSDERPKTAGKPATGHCQKAGLPPKRHLKESRVTPEEIGSFQPGQEIKADVFKAGQRVDVIGTSKGRGTAGVIKRHHFSGRGHAHGAHESFRHGGSIGPGTFPGKVIKGLRMSGRLGNSRVTTRNVVVVKVDPERNLLLIRGSVPGHINGIVRIRPARTS